MEIKIRILYWCSGGWQDWLGEKKGLMRAWHWKINSYILGRFLSLLLSLLSLFVLAYKTNTHENMTLFLRNCISNNQISLFSFSDGQFYGTHVLYHKVFDSSFDSASWQFWDLGHTIWISSASVPHVRNKENCIIARDLWKELNEIILMFFLP